MGRFTTIYYAARLQPPFILVETPICSHMRRQNPLGLNAIFLVHHGRTMITGMLLVVIAVAVLVVGDRYARQK